MKQFFIIIMLTQIFLSLFLIYKHYKIKEDIKNLRDSITRHMGDIEEKLDYLVNATD